MGRLHWSSLSSRNRSLFLWYIWVIFSPPSLRIACNNFNLNYVQDEVPLPVPRSTYPTCSTCPSHPSQQMPIATASDSGEVCGAIWMRQRVSCKAQNLLALGRTKQLWLLHDVYEAWMEAGKVPVNAPHLFESINIFGTSHGDISRGRSCFLKAGVAISCAKAGNALLCSSIGLPLTFALPLNASQVSSLSPAQGPQFF